MAKKLFEFHEEDWQVAREKSHKTLEKVMAEGKYPKAECREDWGTYTFSVWSEATPPEVFSGHNVPEKVEPMVSLELTDEHIKAIAVEVAKLLKEM